MFKQRLTFSMSTIRAVNVRLSAAPFSRFLRIIWIFLFCFYRAFFSLFFFGMCVINNRKKKKKQKNKKTDKHWIRQTGRTNWRALKICFILFFSYKFAAKSLKPQRDFPKGAMDLCIKWLSFSFSFLHVRVVSPPPYPSSFTELLLVLC